MSIAERSKPSRKQHVRTLWISDVHLGTRDCLAERLSRMTVATLRDKLKDDRTEVRRAATLACAMKEDKAFIPDLIAVLDDAEGIVVRAAGAGLRVLTGENFGPPANATPEERAKAIAACSKASDFVEPNPRTPMSASCAKCSQPA